MTAPPEIALSRPVSTRSAVLSLLLGADPPTLPARDIVGAMSLFDIAPATTRVALSRMLASGDLERTGTAYTLSPRLVERQTRQQEALEPATRPWNGEWEVVLVTATGRGAAERADLRTLLGRLRLAEVREGAWMRPANLARPLPAALTEVSLILRVAQVEEPAALSSSLWDLDSWAERGRTLLTDLAGVEDAGRRFATMARTVRHLLTDPVLPSELVPDDWPGDRLRAGYADYRRWLIAMTTPLPATSTEER